MRVLIIMVFVLSITSVMAQFTNHRSLLIFADNAHHSLAQKQLDLLNKDSAAVAEREVKVTVIEEKSSLYDKYKIKAEQFTVILVGKDGYEKYRCNKLLQMDDLFAIIDAMPMRKREMGKN